MIHELTSEAFGFLAGQTELDPSKPTLLFIHGAGLNSHFWEAQLHGLSLCANTLAIDLPAHGRSTGECCTTVEASAANVLAFMDTLDTDEIIPCGLSMGGAIVLQMLLDYPERFERAILMNTGARLRVLPDIFDAVTHHYDAYRTSLFHFAVPAINRTDEVKKALDRATESTGDATLVDLNGCDAFDVMGRLTEIKARTLVLAAEKDISTPLKYGQLLSDKIESASFAVIKGCGHFSPLESPAEVNQAILTFL